MRIAVTRADRQIGANAARRTRVCVTSRTGVTRKTGLIDVTLPGNSGAEHETVVRRSVLGASPRSGIPTKIGARIVVRLSGTAISDAARSRTVLPSFGYASQW
jgi:hypothetical protein